MNTDDEDLTELELEENVELDNLLELLTDWIWMMDTDGIHVYSNQAVEPLLGYKRKEIIGKSAWELWPEEDKEKIDKSEFQENLKDGDGWTKFPGKFKHKDGSMKYLESSAVPIYDEEDSLIGYLGIDRDITETRKIRKREKFLHSLLRHDLKNKLQITKGYLQLSKEEDMSDEAKEFVQKALDSLETQEELIDKIRKLRKINEEDTLEEVNLKKYLERAIDDINAKTDTSDVEISFFEEDFTVFGGELLEEVFFNLLENSLKHSRCDIIEISTEIQGDTLIVDFEDDGKGIDNEKKDKIFERGFKGPSSKGTGLGMYMVKSIIEGYGGEITVEDSDMGGGRFKIKLKMA